MPNIFKESRLKHKLLVTIVKKGLASNVVKASKKSGAGGGTILYGKGTGVHEHATFFGFHLEPEKEIILTLVSSETMDNVLKTIVETGKLEKPGTGVGFVIDTGKVAGISYLLGLMQEESDWGSTEDNKEMETGMDQQIQYDLIVTVVNKGMSDIVVDASKRAGAEGGTIIYGRGTGIHEQAKLFSIQIEPEKELVLTLIDREKTDQVLTAIMEDAELDKPSKGIAFVLPVERTVGINHHMNRTMNNRVGEGQS